MLESDTPKTDDAIATWASDPLAEQRDKAEDFARQLERELAQAQARCAEMEKDAARWRFYEMAMRPGSGYCFGYGMPWLDDQKNEVQIEKDDKVIAKGRSIAVAIDAALKSPL